MANNFDFIILCLPCKNQEVQIQCVSLVFLINWVFVPGVIKCVNAERKLKDLIMKHLMVKTGRKSGVFFLFSSKDSEQWIVCMQINSEF